MVTVMDPWHKPMPLSRVWCLWELFCAHKAGKQLEVVNGPESAASFRDAIASEGRFTEALVRFLP